MWFGRKNPGKQRVTTSEPVEDPTIERTYSGFGDLLTLIDMDAEATVETGPYEELTATIIGLQSIIDKIVVDTSEGLSITCPEPWLDMLDFSQGNLLKAIVMMSRTMGKLSVALKAARLKVRITVPEGTCLRLDNQRGTLHAQGVYGDVSATAASSARLEFACITGLDLNADSSTVVRVERLDGVCRAALSYSSQLAVLSGTIESADVSADSSCKTVLRANCHDVEYEGAYNSMLEVAHIAGTFRAELDSSSTASVRFEEAAQCSITAAYNCQVTATGVVREASLKLDSAVRVKLGAVPDRLKARLGYSSSIVTREGEGTANVDVSADSSCAVSLVGAIRSGSIKLAYGSRLRVGELMRSVRVTRDSGSSVETGYFAS